jgi:16S rRNA (guanine966-N2)-methyltransferase
MKILRGCYKGVEVVSPDESGVRPTVDHFKKHILRFFAETSSKVVWDLFCGSGGVGLELLSNGARAAVFVDQLKKAVSCVNLNSSQCGLKDPQTFASQEVKIVTSSVENFLKAPANFGVDTRPDFIFMDPPYGQNWMNKIPNLLKVCPLVDDDTLILAEHVAEDPLPEGETLFRVKQEIYGPKILTAFSLKLRRP